jgi:hypothetical protein
MDWDTLEKPWSREQCRDRYVRGFKIGLRGLAEISGVSVGTLNRWSSKDQENLSWPEQRNLFDRSVITKTITKVDEAVGDAVAGENAVIIRTHYEAFGEVLTLGRGLTAIAQKATNAMKELSAIDPYKLQALASSSSQAANIIKTAVDGQRQALWLDLENINVAIGIVEKHGYCVSEVDPEESEEDQEPEDSAIVIESDDPEAAP